MNNNKLQTGGKTNSKFAIKHPLEAYTRTIIEKRLESLGYGMDERDSSCNVYRLRKSTRYHLKI